MKLNSIAANQTEITFPNGNTVFFSYNTPVAARVNGKYYVTEHKWSRTTARHITSWLGAVSPITKPQTWFDALAK
jgi:hypothetical protein